VTRRGWQALPPVGEFELIRRYFAAAACAQAAAGVALGIGDDCALLELPAGEQLAVSTDTLVAGVHFPEAAEPFLLAQRALGVSVSDLAAMGATPIGFTLALTLPRAEPDWLQAFARGLDRMAQDCAVRLIGGDTSRGPLSLTLTVFGRVPQGLALTRVGARAGDLLCVGGELGDGAGALPLVLGQRQAPAEIAEPLLARYWSPRPQLALGVALRGKATAALDISDGLLADCGHIAAASGVALLIEQARLPLSQALLTLLGAAGARDCALSGGDDYLLAFTLPAEHLTVLQAQGWPVHVIGRVEAGSGVQLLDQRGQGITPQARGYQHFGSDGD
jgi:thiamine-monophosphate kinase